MGLFKPAWQNKDGKKAFEAVKNITDQTLLLKIATSAGALYKSEDALDYRLSAYDQRRIQEQAVIGINDPKVLQDLICRYKDSIYSYIKDAAERRLNDLNTANSTPVEIALISTNKQQAMSELKRIDSNDDLVLIARTAKLDAVRYEAAALLHDQELLFNLAQTAKEMQLRVKIARELDDPQKSEAVYIKIAKDYSVIEAYVKKSLYPLVDKLTGQKALEEVAFSAKSVLVRYYATTKLIDKETALRACDNLVRDDSVHDGVRFNRAVDELRKKFEEMT